MNFLSPVAFAFLAALPVVIVFYLLKRKRVVKVVSSTLLWQKFLAETQANAPFQKLRHNWLLLLQLLLLLLAVLALARPYFSSKMVGGRLIVAILDASASMQSIDESPTRFEKSRREALKLIDSLHDNDQMVILQAGANTEVKQSPTSEKAALRRAVQSAVVTDAASHLAEALKLAETLIQNNTRAEVHLFSDGATGNLAEFESKNLPLTYHHVGTRAVNIGVVHLDVRQNPENPTQRAIFATVSNFSTNQQQARLDLLLDGAVIDVKQLTLAPRESSPQVFLATQEKDGVFTMNLTAQDDLSVDNRASIVSLLPQPIRVLLVTHGNRFLEKALKAAPGVVLSIAPQLTETSQDFELVVLDNVPPITWPTVNVLAINIANTNWFQSISKIDAPPIVDWKSSHPLLRFVSFDTVQISEALAVQTPVWGIPLLESPNTPLMLSGEVDKRRVVWIGFDVLQSTWPLRISFPIFIANAVDYLNPANSHTQQLLVQSGQPFRFALKQPLQNVDVTLPDGTKIQRPVDAARQEFVFGDTAKQGVYQVQAGTNQVAFCVNLLNSAESDITPRPELQLGKYARANATTYRQASLEIWRWIALTALLVCLFEWWFYHRRTA
ncbi:MAG: BatA and WFA domain-containing protein [Verrucomicrobiota bacterium]|nr:BatA and WFA domain-containing protein [Verrucomicrobiota bacterium]